MTHETFNALRFRIAKVRPAFGEVGHNYGLPPAENISATVWAHPTRLTCNVYKEASLQAGMSTGVNGASNPWKVVAMPVSVSSWIISSARFVAELVYPGLL